MKGQITLVNLVELGITLLVYFMVIYPLLNPIIVSFIATLDQGTSFGAAIAVLANFVLFLMLLMIILTGFQYAIPQRENYPYR